jgi:ATP-dependent RNA helicase DDX52/ROK1
MRDPIRVFVGRPNAATETVNQELLFVGNEEGKIMAMRQLLTRGIQPPILLFMKTVERAEELFEDMRMDGRPIPMEVIHAGKSESERALIIRRFHEGSVWILITTDLLARGIDFANVQTVINYDVPETTASYIHRIGRTGRAGRAGHSITFFTIQDRPHMRSIANVMKASNCYNFPDYLLEK